MADAAVKMAKAGCTSIAVLGVDFMSENVRAILDEGGYRDVQVTAKPTHTRITLCRLAHVAKFLSIFQHT